MNKKLASIIVVLILLLIGGGLFLTMKKSPQPQNVQTTPQVAQNKPSNQAIQGTLNSLLSSSTAQKCTYSSKMPQVAVDGIVYVANGKMRGDFTSTANQTTINGHMIIDSGYSYFWTDANNQGFKTALNQVQPANVPQNNQAPDINKTMTYSCEGWSSDDSKFALPSSVTFSTFVMPSGTMHPETTGTSMQPACSACDNVPAGPGRTACKAQLHCP